MTMIFKYICKGQIQLLIRFIPKRTVEIKGSQDCLAGPNALTPQLLQTTNPYTTLVCQF